VPVVLVAGMQPGGPLNGNIPINFPGCSGNKTTGEQQTGQRLAWVARSALDTISRPPIRCAHRQDGVPV